MRMARDGTARYIPAMRRRLEQVTRVPRAAFAQTKRHADVQANGPAELLTVALFVVGTALSRLGERLRVSWLVYNPFLFGWFHLVSVRVAPGLIGSLRAVFPTATKYADVGAGSGGIAAYAKNSGLDVVACEYSPIGRLFARAQGVRSVRFDVAADSPAILGHEAHIAYCIEVAEHLPEAMGERLIRFLSAAAPTVVFTAAPPGQGGQGHINEKPQPYWIERFRQAGMDYLADQTAQLRSQLRANLQHGRWIPDNVMVFQRAAA